MLAAVLLATALGALSQPVPEVLREIRVQGNVLAPEDEVIRLSGLAIGDPVTAEMVSEAAARLRATKRFEGVEVLKRFASISDPSQIVLVIVVDEGSVTVQRRGGPNGGPRVVRRQGAQLQYLPVLQFEDGYGFTYGARIAVAAPVGPGSRLSFPVTWGGEKRAAAQLDFDDPPHALRALSRLQMGGSFARRENPHYEADDDRSRAWVRAERLIVSSLRAGGTAGIERAGFGGRSDRFARLGADVALDTRVDSMLARNAVYARAAWNRLGFEQQAIHQYELEARGYLGLAGQSTLMARAERHDASRPLPPYLRPLLGGMASVRGLAAGTDAGDTRVSGTVEVLLPLTSPLSFGRLGVSAFVDGGTAYDKGERLADQRLRHGAGGAVWFAAAFLRAYLAVAHAESSTRVHFSTSLAF